MEQRSAKYNHPVYHYGLKNISGWGAKSQWIKWNFQRGRKTLTTKTQRHEVLVKRLRKGEKETGNRKQETVRTIKINRSNYLYGLKNISGWEAKSQWIKWNFQRGRKTLTTKTQRHEVLVKRLREETEKENGRQFCGNWFGYL